MSYKRGLFKVGASLKKLPHYVRHFSHHWDCWSRGKDTLRSARNYLTGIILPGKRKNMSTVAKKVRLDTNVIQQFVSDSPWDPDKILDTNIQIMSSKASSETGVFVIDDTGQKKKGRKSPGVKRQYSGTLGKTGNCQILVHCMYAIPGKRRNADAIYWPTGMRGYLPEEWCKDMERRKEAGIPDDIKFKTKLDIGLELLDKARKKVPHQAVTADTAYGTNGGFRSGLREREEPYAVAVVPSDISVVPEDTPLVPPGNKPGPGRNRKYPGFPTNVKPKTADIIASEISNDDYDEVIWSEGTKRKLSALFARLRVRVAKNRHATDETGWLLLEKSKKDELKGYMCWGLDGSSLEELVKIVHIRWTIEQCHKQMKGELGLDEFEGRKWKGWNHHVAMVLVAFCYLMLHRVIGHSSGEKLPTLPRVRREVSRIFIRRIYELKFNISPEKADEFLEEYPFLIPE